MAAVSSSRLFFRISRSACCCTRLLSTNQGLLAGQKWRIRQGQAPDGLRYGPLTDLPDWSYSDGQPAPETKRRRKRMRSRLDVAERVAQLLSEVEAAKNNPSDNTNEEESKCKNEEKSKEK